MKKIIIIILAAAVLILAAGFVVYSKRADIIRDRMQNQLEQLTGTKIEMEDFEIQGLRNIQIKTLKIMNSGGDYKQSYLALLKNIVIQMDGWKYLSTSEADIHKVQAGLVEVNLERHPKGDFNLLKLAVFSENALKQSSSKKQFLIERFELDFGKAVLYEYAADQEPQMTEVDFENRREVYGRITDPAILIYAPSLKIVPEFKRGNMGLPRTELQKKIAASSGVRRG